MVNEVNFVRKCIATDTSQYDLWGKLVCTNFKISFITDDLMPLQVGYCSRGCIIHVISEIIHTVHLISDRNECLLNWLQDEVPLSCSECVALPSIHIRRANLYRSTSSSIHSPPCVEAAPGSGFGKGKAGIIHKCVPAQRGCSQMSLGQVSHQQNSSCGGVLLVLLMEGKVTMK